MTSFSPLKSVAGAVSLASILIPFCFFAHVMLSLSSSILLAPLFSFEVSDLVSGLL